jgi:hypothetical protein
MQQSAFDYGLESSLVFTAEAFHSPPPNPPVPFQLASHAIRYAVEAQSPAGFDFIYLEVNGKHYDEARIRELYDAASYPLKRYPSPTRLPGPNVTDDWTAIAGV